MPIITGPQPQSSPSPQPESSVLGSFYRIFGVLALLGAILVIGLGVRDGHPEHIVAGCIGILAAIILFGVAEFFNQVARIAAATEETARILRQHPPA